MTFTENITHAITIAENIILTGLDSANNMALAFSITVFLFGLALVGLGAWARAKEQQDFVRFFAIFAYPFFCWSPIVFSFSTLALLEFLSWQYTVLVWLIVLGGGTALWRRGQKLEAQARNPLRGILD